MTSLHPMLTIGQQMTEHVRRLGRDRRSANLRAFELLDQVRIPDPRTALRRVPASVLRRDAAADRDRDRARVRAEAADRGRADDCARRHRAGGHPAAARPAAARERSLRRADHARPRRDVGDRGPRSRSSTPGGSSRRGRATDVLRRPRHPYTRALLDALPHPEAAQDTPLVAIDGAPPSPQRHSVRLSVPSALRVRDRRLLGRGPAAGVHSGHLRGTVPGTWRFRPSPGV